jgi:hypothetical protein
MSKHIGLVLAGAFLYATLSGCKEDPPPPPPAVQAEGSAAAAPGAPGGSAATRARDAKVARVDAETTKILRAEACYWGTLGIALTRDAYLASMKDTEPSADKMPTFGDFPEHVKQEEARKKAGREPLARIGQNLPYLRHLRACQHAKTQKEAKLEGLDPALEAYEAYITALHDVFVKATRYYARKQYEKDEFKEGKEIDKKLKELLPQFDEKRAAFATAYAKWFETKKDWKPKEELDAAGKVTLQAATKAHETVLLLLADKRDNAAITKSLDELKKLETELKSSDDGDKRSPYPRVVGPAIADVVKAVEEALAIEGTAKLTPAQVYPAAVAVAVLYDLEQRAIEQALRAKGGKRSPMKVLNPNQRGGVEGDRRQRGMQPSKAETPEVE